jgi:hypothetical protein
LAERNDRKHENQSASNNLISGVLFLRFAEETKAHGKSHYLLMRRGKLRT